MQGYVHALRKQLGAGHPRHAGARLPAARRPGGARPARVPAPGREARSAPADARGRAPAQALALWRGPPLADVVFEGPARHEIGRLSELHLATRIERIDAELELGRHAALVGELEMLVAAHPYQERLPRQLMLALYRSGRQAEALQVYQAAPQDAERRARPRAGSGAAGARGSDPAPGRRPARRAPRADARDRAVGVAGPRRRPRARTSCARSRCSSPTSSARRRSASGFAPDEVKALVGECVTQMSQAVEEYGGTVQAYEGDGICAYFGVPQAHEDDPERAARTALRILEVVGDYARDIADAWGDPGLRRPRRASTPAGRASAWSARRTRRRSRSATPTNVAARLQSAAAPGTIAVGDETARRLAHRFAFEPLGEITVKGRAEPVAASRLVGPIRTRRVRRASGRSSAGRAS